MTGGCNRDGRAQRPRARGGVPRGMYLGLLPNPNAPEVKVYLQRHPDVAEKVKRPELPELRLVTDRTVWM